MTSAIGSLLPPLGRGQAERFDALVEQLLADRPPAGPGADGLGDLLALAQQLRLMPAPAPRPEFVTGLRSALMAEAATVLVPGDQPGAAPTRPPAHPPARPSSPRVRRPRRLAVTLATAALVGGTASVSVAAQTALPGDPLYPVKRAWENAETGLRAGEGRTEVILSHASERLAEVRELTDSGDAESLAEVPATLSDFGAQASQGADRALRSGDDAQVVLLREFTGTSLAALLDVRAQLPGQPPPQLTSAARAVVALDQRAVAACAACGGAALDLPPSLSDPPRGDTGPARAPAHAPAWGSRGERPGAAVPTSPASRRPAVPGRPGRPGRPGASEAPGTSPGRRDASGRPSADAGRTGRAPTRPDARPSGRSGADRGPDLPGPAASATLPELPPGIGPSGRPAGRSLTAHRPLGRHAGGPANRSRLTRLPRQIEPRGVAKPERSAQRRESRGRPGGGPWILRPGKPTS